jgi:very-short-patch-repair endonuclease
MSKFLIRCSCIICKQEITSQSLKQHTQKHSIKSHCLECNSPIYNSNKFCSNSCSATYTNTRKDYTIIQTGPKKGTKPKNYIPYTKIKFCEICEKPHTRAGKTCSSICKSTLLSIKVNERINNGWNPNQNRNRSKPSYLEQSFENWLLTNNCHNYIKNKTFRCGDKIFFGDFFFPEKQILIELDGTQHTQSIEYDNLRDTLIANYFKVKTIRISHKEYKNKSKIDHIKNILDI